MNLSPDFWTVVAHCYQWDGARRWDWHETDGHYAAVICAASDEDQVILMHRRIEGSWQLVARLAGPAWRRMRARRVRR